MLTRLKVLALGIRARLMALLLLGIVPLSALMLYNTSVRYEQLLDSSRDQVKAVSMALADRQSDIVQNTHNLLDAISNEPALRNGDWKECEKILSNFHRYFRSSYSIFHVATLDGEVRCSSLPLPSRVNIADRSDFVEAVGSGEFVMGKIILSRTTGLTSIAARHPVRDENGKLKAIVTAQVSSLLFEIAAMNTRLPDGGELIILNHDREVVLQLPTRDDREAGGQLNAPGLWQAILSEKQGSVETVGSDGVKRVYGYTRAMVNENYWMYVVVGHEIEPIRQRVYKQMVKSMAVAVLIALIVLAVAWFGVQQLVLRKISVLVDTVTRLRGGDASARTGLEYGHDELSRIASALDKTAEELERAMDHLREQSVRDPLTGLYNRRYMEETLAREVQIAERRGWHMGVVLCDIDHFKRYNDTYGHGLGDRVLKAVADVMVANVRGGDIVCRFGGEEFAIILPGAQIDITAGRAEAIRHAVAAIRLDHEGTDIGTVTLSAGVAVFPDMGLTPNELIHHADEALYMAKNNGRNRVMLALHALNQN